MLRARLLRVLLERVLRVGIKGGHTRWPQDRLIMAFPPLAA